MSHDSHGAGNRQFVRAAERIALVEMLFALHRLMSLVMKPRARSQLDTIYIGQGVFLGDAKGRPFTANKLAQFLGLPRSTVEDRLKVLKRHNLVVEHNGVFFMHDRVLTEPAMDVDRISELIIKTAEQLKLLRSGQSPKKRT